jgi:hypothetical protein
MSSHQLPQKLDEVPLASIKAGASMLEYALLLVGSTTQTK